MEPIHIVGAIFIAYIVVKEVFVLVKGETKQIARDIALIKEVVLARGVDNKSIFEQLSEIYVCSKESKEAILKIEDYIEDLYRWHDREDDDGVKIWYVRKSLEESIKKLPLTLSKQRDLIESLVAIFDKLQEDICFVKDRFDEIE